VTVNHTLHWMRDATGAPAHWVLAEPKSKLSRRTLPLPASVVSALREHHTRQIQERLLVGSGWQNLAFVFATESGAPLDGDHVRYALRTHLARAGLATVTFLT
jgi:integrase